MNVEFTTLVIYSVMHSEVLENGEKCLLTLIVLDCIVTEHLFSVLLEGYIRTLAAIVAQSVVRGRIGDMCSQLISHAV
jgi:hypothetical protein